MNNIGEGPYGISSVSSLDIAAPMTATKFISSEQKGTPGFTFVGDTTSGVTSEAVGSISVRISGTKKMRVSSAGLELGATGTTYTMPDAKGTDGHVLTMDLGESKWKAPVMDDPLLLSGGSALVPTYSFSTSTDTGMYAATPGILSFSGGGVSQARLSASTGFQIGDGSGTGVYNMPMSRAVSDYSSLLGRLDGSTVWSAPTYAITAYKNTTGYFLAAPAYPSVALSSLSGTAVFASGLTTTVNGVNLGPNNGVFLVDIEFTFRAGTTGTYYVQIDLNGTLQSTMAIQSVTNNNYATFNLSEIIASAGGSPPLQLRISADIARSVTVVGWSIRAVRVGFT